MTAPANKKSIKAMLLASHTDELAQQLGSRPGWAIWNTGNALATTADGLPLWFHGTHEAGFNVFARCNEGSIGFHFGSLAAAECRLSETSGFSEDAAVIPVLLRAGNPLRLCDHECWGISRIAAELVDQLLIDDDMSDWLSACCDEAAVFALLEELGYDAVVYANEIEEAKDVKADSVFVWRAEQVKSPHTAIFDPQDPRLLTQCPADPVDLRDHAALAEIIEQWRPLVREQLAAMAARLAEDAEPAPVPALA